MIGFCIYKLTSRTDGKSYIGLTRRLNQRIANHLSKLSRCTALYAALDKYTISDFDISVLESGLTFEEAEEREKYFIKLFNSLFPNGYNLKLGDEYSEELRRKLCASSQKRKSVSKTTFIGVDEDRRGRLRVRCQIQYMGRKFSKFFETRELAAEAYDKMALFFYGEGARLNFPARLNEYLLSNLEAFHRDFCQKGSTTSTVKGVCYQSRCGKWAAYIKRKHLGYFLTEEEAINKRREAEVVSSQAPK